MGPKGPARDLQYSQECSLSVFLHFLYVHLFITFLLYFPTPVFGTLRPVVVFDLLRSCLRGDLGSFLVPGRLWNRSLKTGGLNSLLFTPNKVR